MGIEQRLDLLLLLVRQLLSLSIEELDPVVLGRVVRRGDDRTEVLREQRDGGGRQDSGKDGDPTRRDDALRERRFEQRTGVASVTPDEDAATARPERGRLAKPLDEIGGEVLADDAPHPVRAEATALSGCAGNR